MPSESGFVFVRQPQILGRAFGGWNAPYLPAPDETCVNGLVDEAPDLELLAPVRLCVVCFRCRPPGLPEDDVERLNRRLGEALLADGRVYAGTTIYRGVTALRPAIVNWRTTEVDIDLLWSVVRELGQRLSAEIAGEGTGAHDESPGGGEPRRSGEIAGVHPTHRGDIRSRYSGFTPAPD